MQRTNITEEARGKWLDVLTQLGIAQQFLKNRHGPCPICGGTDRFRWDNKDGNGTFFCSNCGAGNGVKLLMLAKGISFKEAAHEVRKVVGGARRIEPRVEMTDEGKRAAMLSKWRSAEKVKTGSPVDLYLQRRLLTKIDIPVTIRSDPRRPCMVTAMQAPDGVTTMMHLTLLTEDGGKAPTDKPKLFMPGSIVKGSAVRLTDEAEELGIAEGIETAMSATLLFGTPCWAALNEVQLQSWEPPAGVKRVVVFGDNDRNFVGQAAAYALARRLSLRRTNPLQCRVEIPAGPGDDWNDVLRHRCRN